MDEVADYVASNIREHVSRINGVGNTTQFGSPFAMKIWLDPNKLNCYQLTPADVSSMIWFIMPRST